MQSRNIVMPIALYYGLIYMTVGGFSAYIGLYYASIELDHTQIGLLISLGSVTALIAQPVWGIISDRAQTKNSILFLCLLASTLTIWLIPLAGNRLWLLIPFTAVFYFFQCVVNPLSDTITLELSGQGSFSFSFVRTIGSLGYALMSAVAGWIFEYSIDYIFVVFSGFMLLSLLFSRWIPRVEGHQRQGNQVNLSEILKNKQLIGIYFYTFLVGTTLGFFFAFHAIYSQEQGIGTDRIGLAIMLGSLSQFPFMLMFDRIYRKFGIVNIFLFSGLVLIVRWILYAWFLNSTTILFIWILHGGTYILFYLCLAEYVNRHVVKELKASAQMLNSIVLMGLSKLAGGIAGGYYAAKFGFSSAFLVCAMICSVAVAILFAAYRFLGLFKGEDQQVPLSH